MKPKIKIINFPLLESATIRRDWYKTTSEWRCSFKISDKLIIIHIDCGAQWDGASIHWLLWSWLGLHPGGLMLAPSLVHDGFCLTHRGNKPDWFHVSGDLKITPHIRDYLFKECCKHVGVLKHRARIMWFMVTIYQRVQCRKQGIKYKGA